MQGWSCRPSAASDTEQDYLLIEAGKDSQLGVSIMTGGGERRESRGGGAGAELSAGHPDALRGGHGRHRARRPGSAASAVDFPAVPGMPEECVAPLPDSVHSCDA